MIYSVYLAGIAYCVSNSYDEAARYQFRKKTCGIALLADYIRKHPEHKFCIVTTVDEDQKNLLKTLLEVNGMKDNIVYKWERGVTNANYPEQKRRLHFHVLQGKA